MNNLGLSNRVLGAGEKFKVFPYFGENKVDFNGPFCLRKRFLNMVILLVLWVFFTGYTLAEDFLLPLTAGKSWLVTVEVGGEYFSGLNSYHTANGYFSIDFDDVSDLGYEENVPVLAALGGIVTDIKRDYCDNGKDVNHYVTKDNAVLYDPTKHGTKSDFGNYVRITHSDPATKEQGFETIYAHLKCGSIPESITNGSKVARGDIIGAIGNSGSSSGSHLHFQVKYDNDSKSSNTQLINSTLEGQSFTYFEHSNKYLSNNTTGLEAAQFDADFSSYEQNRIIVLNGGGNINGTVTVDVKNNLEEDVLLHSISIYGKPENGNRNLIETFIMGVEPEQILPGAIFSKSLLINIDIDATFIGDYILDSEFGFSIPSEPGDKNSKGGKSDSIFIIADGKSTFVDNHQTDVFNNQNEPLFKMTGDPGMWGTQSNLGFRGSNLLYLSPPIKDMTVEWNPNITTHGRYDIFLYVPKTTKSNVEHGKYTLFCADPNDANKSIIIKDIEVDQKYNRGKWIYLGAYFLSSKYSKIVWHSSSIVEFDRSITFDAMKFIYTGTANDFNDVKVQDWFYEFVNKLKNQDIVSGKGDNTYDPTSNITRAEFLKITMLGAKHHFSRYLILEVTPVEEMVNLYMFYNKTFPFTDVSTEDWYYPYVALAYHLGIVSGRSWNQFAPNDPVTRCEALKMLVEAFSFDTSNASNVVLDYSDIDLNEWYIPYLKLLSKYKVVEGYPDKTFKPASYLNRAEAAKIVSIAIDKAPTIPSK